MFSRVDFDEEGNEQEVGKDRAIDDWPVGGVIEVKVHGKK